MNAFDKAWFFLRKAVDYPMSFDVPSDRLDEYDREYAMFGGAQGLRNQHQGYLQAYHGGYPKYAGIELPGDFLHDEEFMADEEPPMSFDEFAQMEIRNMKDFKSMPYFRKYPERFKDDYGDMIDDGSNY
tara:strand:- start:314 stop:700 length:387 start_codon:yes stop_codon:yes gene_type:complete